MLHLNIVDIMREICGVQKGHQRENNSEKEESERTLWYVFLKSSLKIWETLCQISKLGKRVPDRKGNWAKAQIYETYNISLGLVNVWNDCGSER